MKIVFLSSFFNHHQSALSEALAKRCEYSYVATAPMPQERKSLGYGVSHLPSYVVEYENEPERVGALLRDADVVIAGSAPERLVRQCVKRGQIVLRYYERPLKNGPEPMKFLPRLIRWHWRNPPRKPIYLLCASAYTAKDFAKFGLFKGKGYRWGYFPETKTYDDPDAMIANKKQNSLLWAGRFLDLKHPDDALEVARRLKEAGYRFTLNLIGMGEMESRLQAMIRDYELEDCVSLLGAMKPDQVRRYMEQSEIFLFTSDRREGWGAVANEAMNSGCVIVADSAIGSVPFLIQNGKNGLVYPSRNVAALYETVKTLLDNREQILKLGQEAYQTIYTKWNAEVAAERLLQLVGCMLDGSCQLTDYLDGPCSAVETGER